MVIDPEKLAKLQKSSAKKIGGQRIKAKKVNKSSEGDDSKLQATLQKFNPTTLTDVSEANFFKDDGTVLHFNRVGVQAAAANNTYAVTGFAQEKNITELLPGILTQLGAENLELLQKLAQSLQSNPDSLAALKGQAESKEEDIPELVEGETFDDVE
ncbi:Nascent polypeptide-associated complex subunit beta [Pichia californica]|uniref:Nascent polypeptide-associated complex subunit beta n=1 Tax=Pichia californica TaxID=460514 RepID=A0A9P7BH24_9ASCO|nr:Nascent polypeptide-associated complex subunit beta [[Candida] californica]KAG0689479.1 Nascent polypeptide-associated complex subunit beta [[Candida] californica]